MSLQLPFHYLEHPSLTVQDAPILVMLHGYGSHEEDLFSMRHALFPGFHLLSLRAPISLPWGGFAWFNLDFLPTGIRIDDAQALATRDTIIAALETIRQVYQRPVVMMGFSQGTIMSLAVAVHRPELIRGVIGFSGRMTQTLGTGSHSPAVYNQVRIIQTHGSADPVIPISEARAAATTLSQLGFNHTYKEYTFQHEISMNCLEDVNHWISVNYNYFTKPE